MADAKKILVVEDDAATRELVALLLSRAGYEVRVACDGLEALKVVDTTGVDLVLCDIKMPQLDGLTMARGLRNNNGTAELPVMFLTASEDPDHISEAIAVKARHIMAKPFHKDALLAKVQAIIGPPA